MITQKVPNSVYVEINGDMLYVRYLNSAGSYCFNHMLTHQDGPLRSLSAEIVSAIANAEVPETTSVVFVDNEVSNILETSGMRVPLDYPVAVYKGK